MADYSADAAIIDRRVGMRIEEGRLQDRSGEHDLHHAEIGIGVDLHRRHAPFPAIDGPAELADIIVEFECVGAHRIAEQVVALDLQPRIIAPFVGIADLGREGGQLLVRARLGRVAHPGQRVDTAAHGGEHILDQLVHRRLGFGREIFGDVNLADFLAQRFLEEGDAALPALLAFGRARQGGAVEGEIGVGDRIGQIVGIGVQAGQQQPVLEHLDRRLANQRRFARDSARLRHQQAGRLQIVGGIIAGKVETGRRLLQLRQRHLVIGLVGVTAVDLSPMNLGDLRFERHQRGGARLGVAFARQGEHLFQMSDIGGADRGHLLALVEIIVAIGQAQAALHHREDVGFGVLVVLAHIEAEGPANAGAGGLGRDLGVAGMVLHRVNLGDPGLDRRHALRFDRRLVHIGGIGVADLAGRIALRGFEDALGPLARQVVQDVERAIVGFVGGDRRVLRPGAIGIVVEVVARLHRLVHAAFVKAVAAISGLGGGRGGGGVRRLIGMGHGRGQGERAGCGAQEEFVHQSVPCLQSSGRTFGTAGMSGT